MYAILATKASTTHPCPSRRVSADGYVGGSGRTTCHCHVAATQRWRFFRNPAAGAILCLCSERTPCTYLAVLTSRCCHACTGIWTRWTRYTGHIRHPRAATASQHLVAIGPQTCGTIGDSSVGVVACTCGMFSHTVYHRTFQKTCCSCTRMQQADTIWVGAMEGKP